MKAFPPGIAKLADFERADLVAIVPNDVKLEDILTPGKWANNWQQMPFRARIEIMREDMTLDGAFRVIESKPGIVKLRAIGHVHNDTSNLDRAANASIPEDDRAEAPEGYLVKHTPALQGYYVKLKETGDMVTNGQKGLTRQQAMSIAYRHHETANTPLQTA